jgi:hypothetical protein
MLTNLDEAHTARVTAEQQSEVNHLLNDRCTALMLQYALLCSLIFTRKAQSNKRELYRSARNVHRNSQVCFRVWCCLSADSK